jgi:hypothetical protein
MRQYLTLYNVGLLLWLSSSSSCGVFVIYVSAGGSPFYSIADCACIVQGWIGCRMVMKIVRYCTCAWVPGFYDVSVCN